MLAAVIASPVQAQEPKAPRTPDSKWVAPPDEVPKVQRGDRIRNVDFLFDALKIAPDDESAKAIENRIWGLWLIRAATPPTC